MYGGYMIEEAPVNDLYANPQHPYTIGLLGSLPRLDEHEAPAGWSRSTACPRSCMKNPVPARLRRAASSRWNAAGKKIPPLETVAPEHRAACWVDPKTGRNR